MMIVRSGRRARPHRPSKPIDCTKVIIVIIFIISIFGIIYLSSLTDDPISFGWGVIAGFVWLIVFILLWIFLPSSSWKRT